MEDGGAMLVEGASGLEGGFKTKKGKSSDKTTCWFILKKMLETTTLKKLTTQAHNCIINFIYLCKFAKFQIVISQENEIDYSTCGTHVLSLISCRLAKSWLLSASIVKMCICSWQFCCLQSMYY